MKTPLKEGDHGQWEDDVELTPEQQEEERRLKMEAFVEGLEKEARRRVDNRKSIESRWLEDLRQYHGQHESGELTRLNAQGGSKVFLNLTRPKTNALIARLSDLLFPTDDRNWSIQPTPVPEISEDSEQSQKLLDDIRDTFADREQKLKQLESAKGSQEDPEQAAQLEQQAKALAAEMQELSEQLDAAQIATDDLHELTQAAKKRSDLMETEIHDQLKESRYQAECRDMIEDACKIGTGVLKGPVLDGSKRRGWRKVDHTDPETGQTRSLHVYEDLGEGAPSVKRVDPWSFFPDPDVAKVEDSEGFFERHLMSKKQFRRFARDPEVHRDTARTLMKAGPLSSDRPSYLNDLTSVTGEKTTTSKEVFLVWEYTGPVEPEDMQILINTMDSEEAKSLLDENGEIDVLEEFNAKIWFCNGRVLKFALHPLDSGEAIYSVFNPEKDEHSLFGFGLPYLMRDNQNIVNSAQRMLLDNAGLSVGPQIIVAQNLVRPQDGNWTIGPRKVWFWNTTAISELPNGVKPFETFNIQSNQADLAAILDLGKQGMDETAAIPQIAQGEQGVGVTKTAQGMALLMNSANVVFRRIVKNFDDDVTVPVIRRMYHFNMQFSDKDEIKGDYDVDARGSSVLLVRELMATNLMMIAQTFGDHPVFGDMIKPLELLRHIFRAHNIPAADIAKSEREWKADLEEKQSQGDAATQLAQMEFELKQRELEIKEKDLQIKSEVANMNADAKREIAEMNLEAARDRLAQEMQMKRDEFDARIEQIAAEQQSKERSMAVEVAMAQQTGQSAGGAV